jgi:hypothetical protein
MIVESVVSKLFHTVRTLPAIVWLRVG